MKNSLYSKIEAATQANSVLSDAEKKSVFLELRNALEMGEVRSADCINGIWQVNTFVKQGILLGFRIGVMQQFAEISGYGNFLDKDIVPPRHFEAHEGVRVVPGGSSVRRGAFVARGVTIMPPAFINVGAYVDADTMVDSHALVGSCAQVGKRVHLSAAAQIGGVLEPVGALPVIIEDDVMVGGNCGVYEGVIVRAAAVLASGTILNASTAVYDLVNEKVYRATENAPLEIPAGAVVIPGVRMVKGKFAQENGLGIQTPMIVKYRDARTNARTALEGALRHAAE
ncbi:MAG: 2,3,4,5-tetrahydropyridine-2,6-dicarboxylate N-succinyltransferase [Candidatus Riflebacteria bacterium]|nr:2,3,4,5-tetrahydropyridine-2,6-dicarboxylate N-succinyltransferase [Candidatus Riflebacteria bacterium]